MKLLSFDEAFAAACKLLADERKLMSSRCCSERAKLRKQIKALDNRITPAARQAAIAAHRTILEIAQQDLALHGSFNRARVLRGIRARQAAGRLYRGSGRTRQLSDDAIRKLLRKYGFRGKPGRPKKG